MVALNRDSAASTEAAMKYFVLGALASGLLLYGMSMIYGATGDARHHADGAGRSRPGSANGVGARVRAGVRRGGPRFKLGVVPFHMWIPDVYHGAPNAMTLFIGAAPEARGVRDGDAAAGQRPARPRGRLAADAGDPGGAVDGRSATSPPSRRPTSSACSPTRPSRTWASCCSACWPAWSAGTGSPRRTPTARRCSTSSSTC